MDAPAPPSDPKRARAARFARTRSRFSALALLALVAALAIPGHFGEAAAQGRAQVYTCQHRVADELLPLAQAVLAGEGEAVVDRGTNALVLLGPPAAVAEAMVLLAKQDRPLRTILVHYESTTRRALDAAGVRIAWRAGGGSWSIGTPTFPPGETGAFAILGARAGEGSGRFAGTLRIVEGQSGRITTGVSVPVTTRRRGGTTTEYVTADSGFDTHGRVLGDGRVQIDLAPLQSAFRRDGSIAFTGGDTSVVLTPGETVVLGGISTAGSEREAGLDGAQTRSVRDDTVLLLRAELE